MNIGFTETSLFGDAEPIAHSIGENFVGREWLHNWEEITSRADWCMNNLPYTGNLLLDAEDYMLKRELLYAYIYGLFAFAIIGADAFLERIITDAVESHGDRQAARSGFGAILASAQRLQLLEPYIHNRVSRLHRIRNNFAHEKGPDHEYRLFRRALAERIDHSQLLRDDAREALALSYGLSAILKRNFPRLDSPGSPILFKSPYKK